MSRRVIEVDQNETLYRQMLNEPWFPNNTEPEILRTGSAKAFLKQIFDQAQQQGFSGATAVAGESSTKKASLSRDAQQLPPYSPELNPIEKLWDLIQDQTANKLWPN